MSYSDFISSFQYGVSLIFNGIITFSNSLINNYFIITIIGISLFISVFFIIIGLLSFSNKKADLDNYNSKHKFKGGD